MYVNGNIDARVSILSINNMIITQCGGGGGSWRGGGR